MAHNFDQERGCSRKEIVLHQIEFISVWKNPSFFLSPKVRENCVRESFSGLDGPLAPIWNDSDEDGV
jgi:hypothetical protein